MLTRLQKKSGKISMKHAPQTTTRNFPVVGMHCASCAHTITKTLKSLPGVEECEVHVGTEQTRVSYDPESISPEKMNQALEKFGYSLEVPQGNFNDSTHSSHQTSQPHTENHRDHHDHLDHQNAPLHDHGVSASADPKQKERKLKELAHLRQQTLVVLPMVVISICMMAWDLGAGEWGILPMLSANTMTFFHHLMLVLATYTMFVVGQPYLQAIIRFARYRVADMDTLVGIGTSVAFAYSFLLSALKNPLSAYLDTSQTFFDVTIVVIGLITLGKFLEMRSKLKTGEAVEALLTLQAKTATVLRDGKEQILTISQVMVGDTIIVKSGQSVPVDGVILSGSSALNESFLTGEALPVDKTVGDCVTGGTLNTHGVLHIQATKIGQETVLARIIRLVEQAQNSKAPIEQLTDRISAIFVPAVLIFSVVVAIAWLVIGSQFLPFNEVLPLALTSVVGILVIACPCALGLATPTAMIVGVGKAAQLGILVKNAESMQALSKVNHILLDKTGTLTLGKPELTDLVTSPDFSQEKALQILASLETASEHPLAQAIVQAAKLQNISLRKVEDFTETPGKGIRGNLGHKTYSAGKMSLTSQKDIKQLVPNMEELLAQGNTPVVLLEGKKLLAIAFLADTLKPQARSVIAALTSQQIGVTLLTGDTKHTAQHIAQQLGISQVVAEVLPDQKLHEIQRLQSQGKVVAMVGDGVNDAPALAAADVGIALSTGSDTAIESADLTLLSGNIATLPTALQLARATMRTVHQNLFWAFFYNVASIPVAAGLLYPVFGILLNPAVAGGAMAFSSVSVVLNALRLKRFSVAKQVSLKMERA